MGSRFSIRFEAGQSRGWGEHRVDGLCVRVRDSVGERPVPRTQAVCPGGGHGRKGHAEVQVLAGRRGRCPGRGHAGGASLLGEGAINVKPECPQERRVSG